MLEKNLTPWYVGEKILTREVWEFFFFLLRPNHTNPIQNSNGRPLAFPCLREKTRMLFSDNNGLRQDQLN